MTDHKQPVENSESCSTDNLDYQSKSQTIERMAEANFKVLMEEDNVTSEMCWDAAYEASGIEELRQHVKELMRALRKIAVYDLYYCSATEDTDFEAQAELMYEIAKEALANLPEELRGE